MENNTFVFFRQTSDPEELFCPMLLHPTLTFIFPKLSQALGTIFLKGDQDKEDERI